ncbi:MAG: hypothetical protein PHW64_03700 [Sulfuricurvum sp.]|nr:hypothetical protein [Sulfuricurvum sp.]
MSDEMNIHEDELGVHQYDGAEEHEYHENDEPDELTLEEGDIFIYPNNVVGLNILSISQNLNSEKVCRVRLMTLSGDPIEVGENQLRNYIENTGLQKLYTQRDRMKSVAKKLILKEGDRFTKEGEFLVEILSDELPYITQQGEMKNIILCQGKDGVVAFQDELEVKSLIFGNSDQFPSDE